MKTTKTARKLKTARRIVKRRVNSVRSQSSKTNVGLHTNQTSNGVKRRRAQKLSVRKVVISSRERRFVIPISIRMPIVPQKGSLWTAVFRKKVFSVAKTGLVLTLIVLLNLFGLSSIGNTIAFYNDVETSSGNAHFAGSLDFSLDAPDDFAPEVTPDDDASRIVDVSNDGSLGFQYTASATNAVGTLCSSLNLVAELDGGEEYNGLLSGFDAGPFVFGDPESWDFTTSLDSDDPDLQETSCSFDILFKGWQIDVAEDSGGFTDEEVISNTVTAGEWEVDSCSADPVEITTVQTGSSFDYSATNPNSNVVVESGGELKSPTSGGTNGDITIDTDCDLTVESGGKITAVKGDGTGGTMIINARNFTVDAGGIVSASSTASGKDGGTATITTTGDFAVNGTFSANGHDDGGSVIATAGGDINVSGSSLTATSINKNGGDILLTATGNIVVPGLISTSGKDSGGSIILLADGSLAVLAGGSVLAESTNKKGGRIEAVIDGASDISGTLSVDGKDGDGLVVMTIQGNMAVGAGGLITANSTTSGKDGGTIGIKVGGDATYNGTVRANATDDGKIIALWSEGSTIISGTVSALGGSGGSDEGGVIDITTRATLSGSGTLDASATVNGSIIQRTVTNSFSGTVTPAATTESITLNDIVLNEIIPDPAGSDTGSAALPLDGEWIELYNKSGIAVDVSGWFLRDANGGILTISAAKGDNDGDLSDAGETIVPAGGTLTVYRNGAGGLTLNDDGDTVQLLTNTSVLVDSFTYVVDVGGGNSIARMPDGTGAWVDPEPTPTALNGGINIEKLRQEFLERLNATVVEEVADYEEGLEPLAIGDPSPANESTDPISEFIADVIEFFDGGIEEVIAPVSEEEIIITPEETEEIVITEEILPAEEPAAEETVLPTAENSDVPVDANEPEAEAVIPEEENAIEPETSPAEPENAADEPSPPAEEIIEPTPPAEEAVEPPQPAEVPAGEPTI
ncbi:MAG: hypothetical protein A3C12_03375 [Candidatus Sungbacteria bacterium RIFCSPHIGHO2_02_FULL_49_20]|uniref:LTD domain-containing protein n=1 Tax=Candidatus Sungbacteria bacterium RIFCSPHIGHO2_02_FULL_49_20 TaxID=1802272 RepID=A0A1G2KNY1_9BACT|nr:MAG: hypothetical protein A3C12_03375 [Candidatus Sungbacteria bacterium RIFCSPHIGHO2_02_FULL_49_20]